MLGEAALGGVVAGGALAVALAVFVDWRTGLIMLGLVLLGGATLRAVLPTGRLGMLAVRGRSIDVVLLSVTGAALVVVSANLGSTH